MRSSRPALFAAAFSAILASFLATGPAFAGPDVEGARLRLILPFAGSPNVGFGLTLRPDAVAPARVPSPAVPEGPADDCGPLLRSAGAFCVGGDNVVAGRAVPLARESDLPDLEALARRIAAEPDAARAEEAQAHLAAARQAESLGLFGAAESRAFLARLALDPPAPAE
jgi:hypothetical protein